MTRRHDARPGELPQPLGAPDRLPLDPAVAAPARFPALPGIGAHRAAGLIAGLQRGAGNAAVTRWLTSHRQAAVLRQPQSPSLLDATAAGTALRAAVDRCPDCEGAHATEPARGGLVKRPEDEGSPGPDADEGRPGGREITFEVAPEPPSDETADDAVVQAALASGRPVNAFEVRAGAPTTVPVQGDAKGQVWPESLEIRISAEQEPRDPHRRWWPCPERAVGHYSVQAQLRDGEQEVTGPGGNTTPSNFCQQVRGLSELGKPGTWYMRSAVVAHEKVHEATLFHFLMHLGPMIDASFFRHNFYLDDVAGMTKTKAAHELRHHPLYEDQLSSVLSKWRRDAAMQGTIDHGPGGATERAERTIVDPMIASICAEAAKQGWGACPGCAAHASPAGTGTAPPGPSLQRKAEPDGKGGWQILFTVGIEVGADLAAQAFSRTANGALDDDDLAALRALALESDRTIDDDERMFLAALLDARNAAQLHARFPGGGFRTGVGITFPGHAISSGDRARVRDFGRDPEETTAMDVGAGAPDVDERIRQLAGNRFASTARQVLALADLCKVPHERVHEAMLAGASDSTAGDRVLAGAVYVIGTRAKLPVADDVLRGAVKVDEVPRSHIGGAGGYMTTGAKHKGDTIYLPTTFDVTSLKDQSTVVHELTHAARDKAATGKAMLDLGRFELEAYRAQARYLFTQLLRLRGADRAAAVAKLAPTLKDVHVLGMLVEARLGRGPLDVFALVEQLNIAATHGLSTDIWHEAFTEEDADLELRFIAALGSSGQFVEVGGLQGESALDR